MNGPTERSRPRLAFLFTVLAAGAVVGGCVLAAGSDIPQSQKPWIALAGMLAYAVLARRAVYLWAPDFDSLVWNAGKPRKDDDGASPPGSGSRRIRRAVLEELASQGTVDPVSGWRAPAECRRTRFGPPSARPFWQGPGALGPRRRQE